MRLRQQALKPVLLGCGAAFLCAAAFLYSADTGAYAMAALLFSLAGVAWESRREARALRSYASALLAFAVASLLLVIAINAIMARPLDFRFWKNSLAILSGYRWIEPSSMSKSRQDSFAGCDWSWRALCFWCAELPRMRDPSAITARTGFLLSAFVFAFITMQSGLVRSDWGHIVLSAYAIVFLDRRCPVLVPFPNRFCSRRVVCGGVFVVI